VHGLRYDPHNPDLYYHLGSARMLAGARMTDPRAVASFQKEAINALEQARLLAPRDEVYALELAAAFDAAARYAEAEWVYYEARQLDPKSISIRRYYDAHLQLWRGEDRTGGAQQKGDS
jgi:Flp pilus assembly protein TadD